MTDYIRRGYPQQDLSEALEKARSLNRSDLLKEKTKPLLTDNNKKIPLILTFNPANPKINKIIAKHWHMIEKCTNRDAFIQKPIIAYRRTKNLSDKLVRAKCSPKENTYIPRKTGICKRPWMCKFCPNIAQTITYRSSVTGREYTGPPKYTCKTENVIYLITCKKCKKQYIGETYRPFHKRMEEHLRYIKNPATYDEPTGRHFNSPGHHISDFECQVIWIMNSKPKRSDPKRISKKEFLIDRLKTRNPRGLNERISRQIVHN
jgi:hypothetical protein